MRKVAFLGLISVLLLIISMVSSFYTINGFGAAVEIDPEFGQAPIIDGNIDDSTGEWKEAIKIQLDLIDLPIDIWVMQTDKELFISLQLDLELGYHNTTEFVGILISNSSSEKLEDFIDAKFIQFIDINTNKFTYYDYYINNSLFLNDTKYDGQGAGNLEGTISVYEFSLPIGLSDTNVNYEDAILDYEMSYAFNITYGDRSSYPDGILKSEIVLINVNQPVVKELLFTELILFIISILVFSIIGILFGYYIYKILKLKEKIVRVRS